MKMQEKLFTRYPVFGYNPAEHAVHVSGDDTDPPLQIKFDSITHKELHPSPSFVLPSSQVSEPALLLSPQVATHDVFVASGDNPAGQAEHESDDDVGSPLQI